MRNPLLPVVLARLGTRLPQVGVFRNRADAVTPVPQPPELPDNLPPAVVAYIRALGATITALVAEVAELKARLNQSSTNSSKPPSSDGPT